MDGENNGKPYLQMDDLGGFNPPFQETPIWPMNSEHSHMTWISRVEISLGFHPKKNQTRIRISRNFSLNIFLETKDCPENESFFLGNICMFLTYTTCIPIYIYIYMYLLLFSVLSCMQEAPAANQKTQLFPAQKSLHPQKTTHVFSSR